MGAVPHEVPTTTTTPTHRGSTAVGDLGGCSTADCWRRCLISASSSQTRLVVKPVGSSTAAVATCCCWLGWWWSPVIFGLNLLYCRPRPARIVGLEIGIPKPESSLHPIKCCFKPRLLIDWRKASSTKLCRPFAGKSLYSTCVWRSTTIACSCKVVLGFLLSPWSCTCGEPKQGSQRLNDVGDILANTIRFGRSHQAQPAAGSA